MNASSAPPLVSILLPAFNAGATLAACLRSVVRQTEARWRCVVVDDGSQDGTAATARVLAARDPRVVVIATPHRGVVAALNTGLAHCQGPYVARMDADDVMHRDRLAAQLRAIEAEPRLAAVGCHVRLFPRAPLTDGLRAYERWLSSVVSAERVRAEAFVECPVAHPTLLVRHAALAALGYRETGWPEDYDLVLRILGAGGEIGMVPRRLLAWRDGESRLWRTGAAYAEDRLRACKAAFLARDFLRSTDRYVLWGYGTTARALRRALLAHGKSPSHLVEVHEGRLGQTIHGAPVIGVEELLRRRYRPVIASVAGAVPRGRIRQALTAAGFRETRDFVCAA